MSKNKNNNNYVNYLELMCFIKLTLTQKVIVLLYSF